MSVLSGILNEALQSAAAFSARRAKKRPVSPDPGAFHRLKAPKSDHFSAGFGKAAVVPEDIDTAVYYIAGYRENNPARGVLDPQYVTALWLDDLSGRGGVLFLAVDAVGLLNKDVNALRERLAAFRLQTGCRNVTVTCTHYHAGIDTVCLCVPLPRTVRN